MTNNNLLFEHLSEEELDDVLIGCATAEAEQHAALCELCRTQLQTFQTSMSAFREGTMAWAQAKSNTVSRDLSSAQLSTADRQPLRWSMGVATTAALAFVLTMGAHRSPVDAAQMPVQQTATTSAQEIADDNAMLEAINSEMSTAAPAPLQQYRPARATARRSATNEVQN